MFRIVRLILQIALIAATIGALLHFGVLEVAAQETAQANETDVEYEFSDSVRLIEYDKNSDGNVVVTIESDRSGVDGKWADGSVSAEGPLPPLQEVSLNEGTNELVLETENCPQGVLTIDGSRYRMDSCQGIQATPEQNLTMTSVVLTGLFIFSFIGLSAAALRQIRKNKVERKF